MSLNTPSSPPAPRRFTSIHAKLKPPKASHSGPLNNLHSSPPSNLQNGSFSKLLHNKKKASPTRSCRPSGLKASQAPSIMKGLKSQVVKIPITPKSNFSRVTNPVSAVEARTSALKINATALALSLRQGSIDMPSATVVPSSISTPENRYASADSDSDSDSDFDLNSITHHPSDGHSTLKDLKDPVKCQAIIQQGLARHYPATVDLAELESRVVASHELISQILTSSNHYYINKCRDYCNSHITALRASSNDLAHFATPYYDFGYLGPLGKTTIVSTISIEFSSQVSRFRENHPWSRKFDTLSFIEFAIAPEVACALIMFDMGIDHENHQKARELMNESSQYGRAWAQAHLDDIQKLQRANHPDLDWNQYHGVDSQRNSNY